MSTCHVYSNRHISNQVVNIKENDTIVLENALSEKRWKLYFKVNNIDEQTLNIKYTNIEDFMSTKKTKFDIVVGNPPYNDGSKGRAPIYDKFLNKLVDGDPEKVTFIIPTNWFSQPHTKLGKDVRNSLKKLGLYKIEMNPVDLFETATVSTCTVFCEKNYTGSVKLYDTDNKKNYQIDDFYDQILPVFDNASRSLIEKLKPIVPYTTYSGAKGDTSKYRIVTSYMCYNIISEHPLNELKVIEPNYEKQSGYRVFAEFDTKDEADTALEYYNSFWHSNLVQFILRRTRTSTTLDNPQIKFVPKLDSFDQSFADEDLYKIFSLTDEEINIVEDDAKKYN